MQWGRDLGCISLTCHISSPKLDKDVFCLLSGHWLFHHPVLTKSRSGKERVLLPGLKPQQRTCPWGVRDSPAVLCSLPAELLQCSAWRVLLGLTGPQSGLTRDVFAAVRRQVAAAPQILWTGQSFLAVFVFFLPFFFLSWEAGSLLFLAVLKHLESPTPSTRWQHRERGHSALQQGAVLNDRAAQNGLPAPLASVHSVSRFSLRQDDSEACAFSDCFSNGSSFLPNGSLLCIIRRETIFSAPDLFGISQEFIIQFVFMPHFLFYCVGVRKWIIFPWGRDSDHPLKFLFLKNFLEGLSHTHNWLNVDSLGPTTFCQARRELKGNGWQGPGS